MSWQTATPSTPILSALTSRHSYYTLDKTTPIPVSKITHILESIIHDTPSAFNSQTTRLIVLYGASHEKFWTLVSSSLLAKIGAERFAKTGPKIDTFKAAFGTVLFYEDQPTVEEHKAKFKSYAQHFEAWSEQTSGMHQIAAWIALQAEGLGCNLQHYNPLVDPLVKEEFGVPEGWKLRAQLVFGGVEEGILGTGGKEKLPLEQTFKVFE
ncbi:Nitroreductase [Aspergillus karnatakaensis]|uniref:Nitroreductase n=1 Tax=Aspergillus karnatakaensis TaxID=1810916 RepID=UPI003CCD77D4